VHAEFWWGNMRERSLGRSVRAWKGIIKINLKRELS